MKKSVTIIVMLLLSVISVRAQKAIQQPKLFDNIYVGAIAGANAPLTLNQTFPLNPTVGIRIGKDLTPGFGFNIEVNGLLGDHCNGHTNGYANHFSNSSSILKLFNVGLNGTINLSNMFFHYKGEPRTIEYGIIAGIGFCAIKDRKDFSTVTDSQTGETVQSGSGDNNELTAKTGFTVAWNIGDKKAWQVYLEPAVLWNLTGNEKPSNTTDGGVQFNKNNAYLQLAVGVNYKFKNSNGTHNFKLYDVQSLNDKINNLTKQLNEKDALLAAKPKEVIKEVTKEVIKESPNSNQYVVFFAKNSAELDSEAKDVLQNITDGATVEITATSSPEGDKAYNQALSIKRAEAVKKYLTQRGITVSSAEGAGVTGESSNRVAIIKITK